MATDASDTVPPLRENASQPRSAQKRKHSSSHSESSKRAKLKIKLDIRDYKQARQASSSTVHVETEAPGVPEEEWELWYISKVCRPVRGAELYFYCRWVEYPDEENTAWEPESSLGHAPDMIHELFTDLLGRARAAVDDYDDLPLAMKSSLLSVDRFKSSLQTGIIYAASAQRIRETKADTLSNAKPKEKQKFKRDMSPGPTQDAVFRCTDPRALLFVVAKAQQHEGILVESLELTTRSQYSPNTTPRPQDHDTSVLPVDSPADVHEQDIQESFDFGEHTKHGIIEAESFDLTSNVSSTLTRTTASEDIVTPTPSRSRSPSSTPSLGTASVSPPTPPASIPRLVPSVALPRTSAPLRINRPAAAIPPNPTRRRLAEKDEAPAQVPTPDDTKLMTPQDYATDVRTEVAFRKETTGQSYIGTSVHAGRLPGFLRPNPKQRQLPSQGEATNLLKETRSLMHSQPTISTPSTGNGWGATPTASTESLAPTAGWGSIAASSWGAAPTAGWNSSVATEEPSSSWDNGSSDDFGFGIEPAPSPTESLNTQAAQSPVTSLVVDADLDLRAKLFAKLGSKRSGSGGSERPTYQREVDSALPTAGTPSPGGFRGRGGSRGSFRGPTCVGNGQKGANGGGWPSQDANISRSSWAVPSFSGRGWGDTSTSQVGGWGAPSETPTAGWGVAPTTVAAWGSNTSSKELESATPTESALSDSHATPDLTPSSTSESTPELGTVTSSAGSGDWNSASAPVTGWGAVADTSMSWSSLDSSSPAVGSEGQSSSAGGRNASSVVSSWTIGGSLAGSGGSDSSSHPDNATNRPFVPREDRPRKNGWASDTPSGRAQDRGWASRNRVHHSGSGSAASLQRERDASTRPRSDDADTHSLGHNSAASDRRSSSSRNRFSDRGRGSWPQSRGRERRESRDVATTTSNCNVGGGWPSSGLGSSGGASGGWGTSPSSGGGWGASAPATAGGWGDSASAAPGGWRDSAPGTAAGWGDSGAVATAGGWGDSAPTTPGEWGAVEPSGPTVDTTPATTSEPACNKVLALTEHSSTTDASRSAELNVCNTVASAEAAVGTLGGWGTASTGWGATETTGWSTASNDPAPPQWGNAQAEGSSTVAAAKDVVDKVWPRHRSPPHAPRKMRMDAERDAKSGRRSNRERHDSHFPHRNRSSLCRSPSPSSCHERPPGSAHYSSRCHSRSRSPAPQSPTHHRRRSPSPHRRSFQHDYSASHNQRWSQPSPEKRLEERGRSRERQRSTSPNHHQSHRGKDASMSPTNSNDSLKYSIDQPRQMLPIAEPKSSVELTQQDYRVAADDELEEGEIRPSDQHASSSPSPMNHTIEMGGCSLATPDDQLVAVTEELSHLLDGDELEHIRDDLCADFVVAVPDIT